MTSDWMRWITKRWKIFGALFLLAAAAIGGGYALLERDFDTPASHQDARIVLFRVPPGAGVKQVARALAEKGLIRSPWRFTLQARLRGGAGRLLQGFYEFHPAMSPRAIYHPGTSSAACGSAWR